MGATAAAMMGKREKDIVRVFRTAGAAKAATAKPIGALSLEESRHFERLQRGNMLRGGPPATGP